MDASVRWHDEAAIDAAVRWHDGEAIDAAVRWHDGEAIGTALRGHDGAFASRTHSVHADLCERGGVSKCNRSLRRNIRCA